MLKSTLNAKSGCTDVDKTGDKKPDWAKEYGQTTEDGGITWMVIARKRRWYERLTDYFRATYRGFINRLYRRDR